MQSDVDDAYLVTRAQDGYLDAFEILVQRYSPIAYRTAFRLLGDHHDAQDIAQESLLAAWRGLPRFRADSSFATWLYQIVTRRSLNRLTRGHRADTVELEPAVPATGRGPADTTSDNHSDRAVSTAVAALPSAQRIAVVLHHFEGLSYLEIASITDSTVAAVRSHLFRARRTLATTLGQWR